MRNKMLSIYSDGGADSRGHAGAACIIASAQGDVLGAYGAYLGTATNNEAEIFSAIMGICFASLYDPENPLRTLRWVSDSEYSIKSATQYMHAWKKNGWKTSQKKPVKNQGLWKTFDAVAAGIKINPEHVYGHSGHPENEACDAAVGYLRSSAGIFDQGPASIETDVVSEWYLLDGRPLLERIRGAEETGLNKEETVVFFHALRGEMKPSASFEKSSENYTSAEQVGRLKKLTTAYVKKIEQNNLGTAEAASPQSVRDAISTLRKWVGSA
jgi:ribonuclease HI